MRVRPFFWLLLLCVSAGVLLFSLQYRPSAPAILRVQMNQQTLFADRPVVLDLHLTDPQGIPINEAHVIPNARMTNMDMLADSSQIHQLTDGHYQVRIFLSMAGPWQITISTDAAGFSPQQQTFYVQVQ
ncbi:MAG: FixH family protein [Ktedonobacteraceae bacterium]|nr:FixH family protein [Ktedonobacteraceae bacterium]